MRRQIFVCVQVSLRLILNKEHRVHGFAHIMEQRADARQQGIRTDQFGRLFSKIGNLQTMLIGARCMTQEELQEGKSGRDISINCKAVVRPNICARKYCNNKAMLEEANPVKIAAPPSCNSAIPSICVKGKRKANNMAIPAAAVDIPERKKVHTRRAFPNTSTPVNDDTR